MPTLMIRLEYPPPGDQLTIRGFRIRHGDLGWHEDVGPVKEVARELPNVTTRMGDRPLEDLARSSLLTSGEPILPAIEVGRQLWNLIADGPVGTWWAEQVAAAGDNSVRTILDIRPPELRELPWELMSPNRGRPVFRDATHPWVRAKPNWPPLEPLLPPIQMLVVVGENGAADLNVNDELEAIHRCVREKPGSWHVSVLAAPTPAQLRACYAEFDPHILHVIGHTEKFDDQYALRIVPEKGQPWGLTVEDVADLPTPAPRLVVLNCCRTTGAGAAAEPAWTFSEAFLELGSAAVLTMQGNIPSPASIAFTSRFYGDLVAGKAIDAAAARARLHVSDVMRERQDNNSWALPSLLVAADPDRVLPVAECLSPAELISPPYLTAFGDVSRYLDRSSERRKVLRELESDHSSRVLLLTGRHQDGRSAVLRSALFTLRLRGRNTVYVDLDEARGEPKAPKLSWLTVLRHIRDAIWEWVPEIPTEPRRRFTHELGYLLDQRDPEPWSEAIVEHDDWQEFRSEGERYREWIAKIVLAFRSMLVAAADEHPLLLALDSLSAIHEEDLRDVLAEQLLLPLTIGWSRDGLDANVRCLVAASSDELTVIPDQFRRPLEQTDISIKPFRRDEVPRLVGEYVARKNLNPTAAWRARVEGLLRDGGEEALRPGNFTNALLVLEGLIG
jgi:hypothetical protein